MNPVASRISTLMGTASLFAMASVIGAQAQTAQAQTAQVSPEDPPEQVLITGSLIHGAVAVGVPVTNLSLQDFQTTGAAKIGDLFKNVPAVSIPTLSDAINNGGHQSRAVQINIHGIDEARAPRSLMMVDGVRFPIQGDHLNLHDPSVIPSLAVDRIDLLADGASATYGSDAVTGVINVILRRGYDGAITQLNFAAGDGPTHYQAAQLWGRTWDGGDITLSYEWYDDKPVSGSKHSAYTSDYRPWGLDDLTPIGSSIPGTISVGATANSANGFKASLGRNCTNCFAIPAGAGGDFASSLNNGLGPTAPSSAPGVLNWSTFAVAANSGTNGTRNIFDPLLISQEEGGQQRNAATATFDQRLIPGVTLYGEGFYSNRRGQILNPTSAKPVNTLLLQSIAVPTVNPYYPVGAPSGLRVAYNLGIEIPPYVAYEEYAARYQAGVKFDLPLNWHGDIYYARTWDDTRIDDTHLANVNAVSAALGWTIASTPPSGTAPGISTFTKPAGVPYLNLFCDPTAFQCNSPDTLNYIRGIMNEYSEYASDESNVTFDGPLFDLPAGPVRAAVGGDYRSDVFKNTLLVNSGSPSLVLSPILAYNPFQVWAGFAQLNVPVFGENFKAPLIDRLDLELSWRHDEYSGDLQGNTSNPKVGFTWVLSELLGLSAKGSWNSSFRLPEAGEYSADYVNNIQAFNLPTNLQLGTSAFALPCVNNAATPGSAAADLVAALGSSVCNKNLGGLSPGGGPLKSLRPNGFHGGTDLGPETSINYVLGGEFAPTTFLKGLDLQATWFSVKINNVLNSFGASGSTFSDPNSRFSYILPSDLAGIGLPNDQGCATANGNPTACAPFEAMVDSILFNPRNASALPAAKTLIYWINDAGVINHGSEKFTGIDWQASYDYDAGDLGAFNTGIVGTYYISKTQNAPGQDPIETITTTIASIGGLPINGVLTAPRMAYRARLGWSDGQWDVTGFMNYQGHYYSTQPSPPNVNNQCSVAGGTTPTGTFPCAITGFTGITPSQYTFDLSFGYNTGDMPTRDSLKNIQINFVINNIMDRHPAFQYAPGTSGHTPTAYDQFKTDVGRVFNVVLTKTW